MRAGDVVRVDFGVPRGSEAGFERAAVVVTASEILARDPRTLRVVPITGNTTRRMRTELPLTAEYPDRTSVAQTHLITTIPTDAVTGAGYAPSPPPSSHRSVSSSRSARTPLIAIPRRHATTQR